MRSKLKSYIKTIAIIICSLIFALTIPMPIHALTNSQLIFMNTNGIYYYNPEGGNYSGCYIGDITIQGSNTAEKIWTGLTTFLTDEQAAGVMGNMISESAGTFNPVIHEISWRSKFSQYNIETDASISYGIGLIQWSWGRRVNMLAYVKSKNSSLMQYFLNPEQYGKQTITGDQLAQMIGESNFDQLIQLELEFLKTELDTKFTGLKNQTTVYDATKYFLEQVERPQNPVIEAHMNRVTQAEGYYKLYHGFSPSSGNSNTSSTNLDLSSITIIGDSLIGDNQHGVRPYLKEQLKDNNDTIFYAAGNYFTSEGIEKIKELNSSGQLRKNIIYALGTDDVNTSTHTSTITQKSIDDVINAIGSNHNIYFVTNYTIASENGGTATDYSNSNALLKQAAKNHSNVHIIDYANLVSSHPEYFKNNEYKSSLGIDDGIHLNADGYTAYAKLIAKTLKANNTSTKSGNGYLSSDGCTTSGNFQQTVLNYAWETYHPAVYTDRKEAYATAVSRRQSEGKYVGGSVDGVLGIDCGGFVTALMQDSGFAPDYNYTDLAHGASSTSTQEQWVKDQGWKLLNSDTNTAVDTGLLQPGDVAFVTGHTFVYVGNIDGFESKIASASAGKSSGRAPMAGRESLTKDNDRNEIVRWYRKN